MVLPAIGDSMGRVLEFALTVLVVNLISIGFACLVGTQISSYIAGLFDLVLMALP